MKKALVLSGGASRGAFHLGVLQYFDDNKIQFDAFSGCSIGSLILSLYLEGITPKEQLKIFKSKEFRKLFKLNFSLTSLFKIDKKSTLVKKLFKTKNIEDLKKPLFLSVLNKNTNKIEYKNFGNLIDITLASCSLPILLSNTKIDNIKFIDSGLIDNLPITPFLNQKYKIVSVDLFPRTKKSNKKTLNPIKYFKRKFFKKWHENLDFAIQNSNIHITSQSLRKYNIFSFKYLDEMYELGYKEASNYLSLLK